MTMAIKNESNETIYALTVSVTSTAGYKTVALRAGEVALLTRTTGAELDDAAAIRATIADFFADIEGIVNRESRDF